MIEPNQIDTIACNIERPEGQNICNSFINNVLTEWHVLSTDVGLSSSRWNLIKSLATYLLSLVLWYFLRLLFQWYLANLLILAYLRS